MPKPNASKSKTQRAGPVTKIEYTEPRVDKTAPSLFPDYVAIVEGPVAHRANFKHLQRYSSK